MKRNVSRHPHAALLELEAQTLDRVSEGGLAGMRQAPWGDAGWDWGLGWVLLSPVRMIVGGPCAGLGERPSGQAECGIR